jgi:hypothetical protein
VLALSGLPDHPLLVSGSGVLAAAAAQVADGSSYTSFSLCSRPPAARTLTCASGSWPFPRTRLVAPVVLLLAMDHNGPELVIALGLLSLVLAVTGSGRLGLDHLIVLRLRRRSQTAV